jgi:hypothetical protein
VSTAPKRTDRPLSLGVIFLTLYIDLVGFSIIFPLFPAMLEYYIGHDGNGGLLGWMLARANAPVAGGLICWRLRPEGLYALSGMIMLVPITMSLRLPQPEK